MPQQATQNAAGIFVIAIGAGHIQKADDGREQDEACKNVNKGT